MSMAGQNKRCAEIAPLLVFYTCEELSAPERLAVDEHLLVCAACRAQLADEQSFADAVSSLAPAADRLDSSGVLLSQCRSELAEQLDDLVPPQVRQKVPAFGFLHRWMALRPALTGALLVAFGLVAGVQSSQWYATRNAVNPLQQAVNIRPAPH